jgi:peptidoglycan/LPS O-acetylase OafA/YrhL
MHRPRLTIAVALLALATLASTLTYTGFLVVGIVAEHLGTGRVMAGLLLGGLFARFPWLRKGKLCTVGLLPKLARRPVMVSLLALCLLCFLSRGDYVSALFAGFATTFLLTFPWIRRAIFDRMLSSLFKPAADQNRPKSTDGTVIDAQFREKKD